MGGRRRETESVLYSTTLHAEQAIEKRVTSSRHCGAAGAVVPDTVEALYHQCKSKQQRLPRMEAFGFLKAQ